MWRTRVAVFLLMGLPVAGTAEERLSSTLGDVIVRPLGMATIAVHVGERVIYVDPSRSALAASVPLSDLVLITDADAGSPYLDRAAIERVRAPGGAVVVPLAGADRFPDAIVMRNGEQSSFGDVSVEAVPAYDLTPGSGLRTRGLANGYILTIGDRRILVAGATECVPELRVVKSLDVAFLPVNLPNGRMDVHALAECVRTLRPAVTYPYLYGESDAGSLPNAVAPPAHAALPTPAAPTTPAAPPASASRPHDAAAAQTIDAMFGWLRSALSDITEIRTFDWYAPR